LLEFFLFSTYPKKALSPTFACRLKAFLLEIIVTKKVKKKWQAAIDQLSPFIGGTKINKIIKMKNVIKFTLFLISIGASPVLAFSQNAPNSVEIKGIITEQGSNKALSYVNIGVLGKPVGTVSDVNGHYSLAIGSAYLSDTLQVSLVGYSTFKMAVSSFIQSNNGDLKLNQKTTVLPEMVVSNKQRKNKQVIGTKKRFNIPQITFNNDSTSNPSGFEVGLRYQTDKVGALLKDFNWFIVKNNYEKIKVRVNIYAIKNDLPDSLLCNKPIYITLERGQTGAYTLDLTPYDITINGDFVVALQWVESQLPLQGKPVFRVPVGVSSVKKAKRTYARKASQDKWEVAVTNFNLTHFVTLIY
jgi:hypothetical protein